MRKLAKLLPLFLLSLCTVSCVEEVYDWDTAAEWQKDNLAYLDSISRETEYTKIVAAWDSTLYVYLKHYNTPNLDGKRPLSTSTVDVIYQGRFYDEEPFDSSYLQVDSIFQTALNEVIVGWQVALQYMNEGDSCRVVIPAELGYGTESSGYIPGNSTLLFDIKLVDVHRDYKP